MKTWEWMKRLITPRKYQMGECPKCKRSFRLPLSADTSKPIDCDDCFKAWLDKANAELIKLVNEPRIHP